MNHFMLPEGGKANGPGGASARYGVFAMELLINELTKLGAQRSCLEAKVFGGGNVLEGAMVSNVGARNAAFALEFLATERIRIAARDLYDDYPRKVYFFPHTGRVMVRKMRGTRNNTLVDRERAYLHRLDAAPIGGKMELFR